MSFLTRLNARLTYLRNVAKVEWTLFGGSLDDKLSNAIYEKDDARTRKLLNKVVKRGGNLTEHMFTAIDTHNNNALRMVLEAGADVNASYSGIPALHHAILEGALEPVKIMVEGGADVNARNPDDGNTALGFAVYAIRMSGRREFPEIARYLIKSGADMNIVHRGVDLQFNDGWLELGREGIETFQLFHMAIAHDEDLALFMLKQGIPITVLEENSWTPLMQAAQGGEARVIKKLLKMGVDVDQKDDEDFTALMAAAYNGHLNVLKLLHRAGANLNFLDQHGRSALHFAVKDGHDRIVRYLLRRGANPFVDCRHRFIKREQKRRLDHFREMYDLVWDSTLPPEMMLPIMTTATKMGEKRYQEYREKTLESTLEKMAAILATLPNWKGRAGLQAEELVPHLREFLASFE